MATIEHIIIGDQRGGALVEVEGVEARAGCGLVGDRYCDSANSKDPARQLTLVAAEALEAYQTASGNPLAFMDARRNLVTRGIDLNALVGVRFRIGEVLAVGMELCEPCATLQAGTYPGIVKALAHKAGLNAEILEGGAITTGCLIEVERNE